MKLWRVTGRDGAGFYYSDLNGKRLSTKVGEDLDRDISSMTRQHPRPSEDGIDDVYDTDFFAFNSLHQLHNWFDTEIFSAACKRGARIEVWEVPDQYVKVGGRQVCFVKSEGKLIENHKMDKFKKIGR